MFTATSKLKAQLKEKAGIKNSSIRVFFKDKKGGAI
jgi:hypothetical protein